MACETPVVGAAVGGIPEIVVAGETGTLVPFKTESATSAEPRDPDGYSRALAKAVNELMSDAKTRERMGKAARKRVLEHFSWESIARTTLGFYRELLQTKSLKA